MVDRPVIPRKISDEAARWVAEGDAGLLSDRDQAALSRWLAADPLHRQAYERASGLWAALAAVPETTRMRPAAGARTRRLTRWRAGRAGLTGSDGRPRRFASAVAACAVLYAIALLTDMPIRLQADAMTAIGEQRLVALPDGSTARLNTGSAISIDYKSGSRRIRLLRGEAEFAVSPDAARPFTVEAAKGGARALGTRFIVRDDAGSATVTVTEHRVAVSYKGRRLEIGEGETVHFGPSTGLGEPRRVEVADAEAWTRGRLIVVNRPLGEVVAELGRYHSGYMRVSADVADLPVSGNFRIDDPVAALERIRRAVGLGSTRVTDRLIFIHR